MNNLDCNYRLVDDTETSRADDISNLFQNKYGAQLAGKCSRERRGCKQRLSFFNGIKNVWGSSYD
jgi:hypothetical protein